MICIHMLRGILVYGAPSIVPGLPQTDDLVLYLGTAGTVRHSGHTNYTLWGDHLQTPPWNMLRVYSHNQESSSLARVGHVLNQNLLYPLQFANVRWQPTDLLAKPFTKGSMSRGYLPLKWADSPACPSVYNSSVAPRANPTGDYPGLQGL